MKRLIALGFRALIVCKIILAADTPAILIKKIDPNQGRSQIGVVLDSAEIELTVDETGVPFSLQSSLGLPDYVVNALEQWRYSPYKKNGRSVPFTAKLLVPVARPLTPAVERSLAPDWYPSSAEVSEAIKRGHELNEAAADALEANLEDAEAIGNGRTSLLVYYANQGAKNLDKARAARARLLTWLVQHYPQDDVLGSSFALVNSSGDPLADASTSLMLTKLWLNAVAENPSNEQVRVHALNFLQVASPRSSLEMLAKLPKWRKTSAWAGHVYGLAAIGVTALSPATGRAFTAADSRGDANAAIDETARAMLLKAADTKMVLAGLVTLTSAGRSLAANRQLPENFAQFCPSLLTHAKELYPQTAQSCDTGERPQDQDQLTITAFDEKLTQAKLLTRISPVYPSEAKYKRVQGTITFSALINKSGEIEELGLKSGPFLLYPNSLDAVRKWRYSPTRINDKPVDFSTTITVNFAFGR